MRRHLSRFPTLSSLALLAAACLACPIQAEIPSKLGSPKALGPPLDVTTEGFDLELETEVRVLGKPTDRRAYEGSLAIGRWEVFTLPSRFGADDRTHYLVRIPMTFQLLEEGRRFRSIQLRLALRDTQEIVVDLFPKRVEKPVKKLCFSVDPDFRFRERPAKRIAPWWVLDSVQPRVLGSGERQSAFGWVFESPGDGLRPGDHSVFFILSLPEKQRVVLLQVASFSRLAKQFLGLWRDEVTVPSRVTARLLLDKALPVTEPPKRLRSVAPPTDCLAEAGR